MPPSIAELTRRFLQTPATPVAGPVEPYDVSSAFRVEPATAWSETLVVLKALGVSPLPKMPADWPGHVRQQSAVRLLPMAAGYFPQMVSELDRVLSEVPVFDNSRTVKVSADSKAHAINESAVALWNAGKLAEARAMWSTLPESAVKAFNLGLAALACGDRSDALVQLTNATVQLSDSSGWHALAEIYITLAKLEL